MNLVGKYSFMMLYLYIYLIFICLCVLFVYLLVYLAFVYCYRQTIIHYIFPGIIGEIRDSYPTIFQLNFDNIHFYRWFIVGSFIFIATWLAQGPWKWCSILWRYHHWLGWLEPPTARLWWCLFCIQHATASPKKVFFACILNILLPVAPSHAT